MFSQVSVCPLVEEGGGGYLWSHVLSGAMGLSGTSYVKGVGMSGWVGLEIPRDMVGKWAVRILLGDCLV